MLTVILKIRAAPEEDLQGIKETVAMALEPLLGDVRVVSITAETPEQMKFDM